MPVTINKSKLAAARGTVVKKQAFSGLASARQVVSEAAKHASAVKAAAQGEVEAARQAGYEAGKRAAQEEFSASVARTVAQMEAAFAKLEVRIVNTVMSAVQQILRQIDDRVVMECLVRRVLAEARTQKQLRLKVAPDQFDQVNEWLAAVLKEFPEIEFVDVLKDPSAAQGTCVLESEFGSIDASLDVQLAAVRRGLLNAFVDQRVAATAASD